MIGRHHRIWLAWEGRGTSKTDGDVVATRACYWRMQPAKINPAKSSERTLKLGGKVRSPS